MIIKFCLPIPAYFNKMLLRPMVVAAFATVGLSGFANELLGNSSWRFSIPSSAAYAQDVSQQDVARYAQAVLAMEPVRQQSYNDIKKIIGGEPPSIRCDQPSSLGSLPAQAQQIAQGYCQSSETIVVKIFGKGNVDRFNQITQQLQSNPNLKKQIQDEMLRLQNTSGAQ